MIPKIRPKQNPIFNKFGDLLCIISPFGLQFNNKIKHQIIMKILDKLKQLLQKSDTPTKPEPSEDAHRHAVSTRIMAWLDKQGWKYEHRTPEEDAEMRTHHMILSFTDNQSDWTCVFRVNENNQLVAIFGVLTETVPPSHYASILMKIARANLNIAFGSIELDPFDGEVRVKISIDAEFSTLSDKALGCYLQGVAGLTEIAQRLFVDAMAESEPSPIIHDYLNDYNDLPQGSDSGFFTPTHTAQ